MNNVNIMDESFINTETYKNFIADNPSYGFLKIRASSASNALPVSGVRIIVSRNIGNYKVIFYDGLTDSSGMINGISLPTPALDTNDLNIPKSISYDIEAAYEIDNIDMFYKVIMYPNIYVVQYINLVPSINTLGVFGYGS